MEIYNSKETALSLSMSHSSSNYINMIDGTPWCRKCRNKNVLQVYGPPCSSLYISQNCSTHVNVELYAYVLIVLYNVLKSNYRVFQLKKISACCISYFYLKFKGTVYNLRKMNNLCLPLFSHFLYILWERSVWFTRW